MRTGYAPGATLVRRVRGEVGRILILEIKKSPILPIIGGITLVVQGGRSC